MAELSDKKHARVDELLKLEREYQETRDRLNAIRSDILELRRDTESEPPLPACVRVLIAERSPLPGREVSPLFEELGCDVDTVTSAQQAIEHTRMRSYDLIIVDMEMPSGEGVQAKHTIRERLAVIGSEIPVVGLSSLANGDDMLADPNISDCRELIERVRKA